MKKMKKYGLIIALAIILMSALIIGIIKFVNSKKEVEVSKLENVVAKEEDETITVNVDEVQAEEEIQENEEELPQEEEQPKETAPKTENSIPYYIKINNQANVVTIYTKDENGNYTVPYKAMICSIGTATPAAGNVYTIPGGKWDRWTWGQMVGGVWAQYYTRIKGSILFHSVPYTSKDKGALEYWEYDKLGTKASAGCIRLTVQDAKWIYDNCKPGTKVEFYEDSNPGPLGKPTAQKISADEAVRGWDPTDPDVNNPWRNYVRPTEKIPESTTTSIPEESPKVDEPQNTQEEPITPAEPTTPTKPEEPEKPTEPEDSGGDNELEPTNPTDSENSRGDDEVEPTNPTEPENSSGDDKGKNITSSNEE